MFAFDALYGLPDVERKPVSLATGKVHKFVVGHPKRRLRLKLAAPGDIENPPRFIKWA